MSRWSIRLPWASAGVRSRTTLVAVVVVGAVLALGFGLLTDRTRVRLEDSIASAAETRAIDVAALAEAGALSGTISSPTLDQHIQVVVGGDVIASTFGLEGFVPFVDEAPPPGVSVQVPLEEDIFEEIEARSDFLEDESPYLVVARGYQFDGEKGTVLVASTLETAAAAVNALRPLLWIGYPITLAAVGLTVWFLTGWALQPVEAMREEADAISAAALSRRLPVPETHDEVRRLADTLNRMLGRLESSSIRQRRFVSDASHELKTPLATIRTMLEVAEEDPEFDDWPGLLTSLKREDERMAGLVSDLLALARFDEGAEGGLDDEVNLDQVMGRVADRTRAAFPEITVDASGIEAVRVRGDGAALERLFSNLGSNAARHAETVVAFSCAESEDAVVARVADDGPGIAPAERERVFERFVRLDESRGRHQGGTGLGLAVVRAIARSHRGDVRVADSQRGTTMEVTLPAI